VNEYLENIREIERRIQKAEKMNTENAALLSAPLGPNTYFLAKPFLPGDLTRLVSSILERPG
jgi:hypothetical protein